MRTNPEWRQALESSGEDQLLALQDLRLLLLRAASYTFQRSLGDLAHRGPDEIQQLAEDCAQEALIAVLQSLPQFRGDSQFTTWAYKFAVNIALTTARRERWKGASLDQMEEDGQEAGWLFAGPLQAGLEAAAMQSDIRQALAEVIRSELTPRQRQVLKWMVFEEVPMDVVVEHLHSNRNAVYKLLHDARRKLKARLLSLDIQVDDALDVFHSTR